MNALLIDVGNTREKAYIYNLVSQTYTKVETLADVDLSTIEQIEVASVRDNQNIQALLATAHQHSIPVHIIKTQAVEFEIKCAYENYDTLGIDRWLAVIAAEKLLPNKNIIIVDAGTAITVDFLSADKTHLGGWIVPGTQLMLDAVTQNTQKVFSDDSSSISHQIGKSTPQALKSGVAASQSGLVRQALTMMPDYDHIVVTGGNANLISQGLHDLPVTTDELLVFKGIARFTDRKF